MIEADTSTVSLSDMSPYGPGKTKDVYQSQPLDPVRYPGLAGHQQAAYDFPAATTQHSQAQTQHTADMDTFNQQLCAQHATDVQTQRGEFETQQGALSSQYDTDVQKATPNLQRSGSAPNPSSILPLAEKLVADGQAAEAYQYVRQYKSSFESKLLWPLTPNAQTGAVSKAVVKLPGMPEGLDVSIDPEPALPAEPSRPQQMNPGGTGAMQDDFGSPFPE